MCKRGFYSVLTVLCIFILLYLQIPVKAETDSEIIVQLEDLHNQSSNMKNVTIELYCVGTVSKYGEPLLEDTFGISMYPQTAQQTETAAVYMKEHLSKQPLKSIKTTADGTAVFTNVDNGVYLLIFRNPNGYGVLTPVLLHLPYYENMDGVKADLLYSITVKPKASLNKEADTNQKDSDGFEKDNGKSVGTGDSSNVAAYMLFVGFAVSAMLCVFIIKRKGGTK